MASEPELDPADRTEAGTLSGGGSDRRADEPASIPERLGRYVIVERIGAGGMGVVYAAYDPELDRKVAIKLWLAGPTGEAARRLLHEAKAMARLSHPHVVSVHDVGTFDGHMFVAMAFVRGETLRRWMSRETRPWPQIVAMFVGAGRGLAAAHEARIVHGDFKPDNVLVDAKDWPLVTDFGLARAQPLAEQDATVADADTPLQATHVRTGMAMRGTPNYMAPELFAGEPSDVASDQFAFCVALWEALFGTRPFSATGLLALATAVTTGELREPPRGTGVPAWLVRTLRVGLANDPERRWPSMDALLTELERGRARARIRRIVAAGVGLAVTVTAGLGVVRLFELRRARACEQRGAAIEGLWHDQRRTAVREALLASGVSYAATTADKLMPWLDRRAEDWRRSRIEVCTAAELATPEIQERALSCLDDRWFEFDARIEVLLGADASVVQRAVSAASRQVAVDLCAEPAALARSPPPPAESRDAVAQARAELWRVDSLTDAGNHASALEVAGPVVARAIEIGWPRLIAESRLRLGTSLQRVGDHEQARQALIEAYLVAADNGAPDVAAAAAAALVQVLGIRLARHEDARMWGRLAEIQLRQLDAGHELQWALLYLHLGLLEGAAGDHVAAFALAEQSLAIRERLLGDDHPEIAAPLQNMASASRHVGDLAQARELTERGLEISEQALGADHPDVGRALGNLANIHADLGDYHAAVELTSRSLAILEPAIGKDHYDLAKVLANLATLHYKLRRYPSALELHSRALSVAEASLGPDHPDVATIVGNIGIVHKAMGSLEAASAAQLRALAIREAKLGPEHAMVATSLTNLAGVRLALGATDEARALYTRAVAIFEARAGVDDLQVAAPLDGLARTALAEHRPADAVGPAERALGIREAGGAGPTDLAEARFLLARALDESGRDTARARALVVRARDGFRQQGEDFSTDLAATQAWLATHP